MARPWAASVSEVLSAHAVSPSTGLSAAKVTALRAEYGSNELDKEEGTPLWKLVLQQFDDLLVKILLGGTHRLCAWLFSGLAWPKAGLSGALPA